MRLIKKLPATVPIVGGALAAIGAGLCCLGPLVLMMLGISGAWIGNLTILTPYRPLFIIVMLLLFAWAGWQIHRPEEACAPGSVCSVAQTRKRRQTLFWVTVTIALLLVSSNYWLPLFF